MAELPSVKLGRWRIRSWVLDLVTGLCGLGLTLLLAIRLAADPKMNPVQIAGTAILALVLSVVSVVKAIRSRTRELRYEPFEEPKELVGWAEALHERIDAFVTDRYLEAGEVRITIHKVHFDRRRRSAVELEQVISYVGGTGGVPGRRSSARSGIIGLVARTGSLAFASRTDGSAESFVSEMVEKWGYTVEEAQRLTPGRNAWLACPITLTGDGPVIGVVFLDSAARGFFDESEIREIIWQETQTLAKIVRRSYSNGE